MASLRTRLACALVLVATWATPALCADEIHWTIMGPTAVTFDWRGSETTIRYGTTTSYGLTAVAVPPVPMPFSSAGPFYEARLIGLQTNTLYHYSVGTGPDHTFRTPPLPGSGGFTIAAEGDIGSSSAYSQMAGIQSIIAGQSPAFVLCAGDLTYGNANGQAVVDEHFNDVMVWSQDAAYMPGWGNHEWDIPSADDFRNYKGRFDLPNPQVAPGAPTAGGLGEDWSWFDYGNARFIAYPEPFTSASLSDWNTKVGPIMDAAQANPAIKYIVTYGHRPAYSSGHHPGESQLKGYIDALGDAHSKYVLNLNGHSHNYERSLPQHGVVHLTVGTGGSSLEEDGSCLWLTCTQPSWSAYRAMHLGATMLTFTDTGILGRFLCGPSGGGTNDVTCSPGTAIDNFTIPTRGGSSNLITDPTTVFSEPLTPKPAYLVPTLEPTFNTYVTRIGDDTGRPMTAPVSGSWGSDARHTYQKQQPWNSNNSLIVIENRGGSPSPLFLDGTTYLPKFGECSSASLYDYRWHPSPSHANEMINVTGSGTELMWYDVVNCVKTRTWSLPIASNYGIGSGEGNPSNDGRFVVVGSATQMMVVDMDPQPPFAAYPNKRMGPPRDITDSGLSSNAIDWVGISASGKYAVVNYDGDYPRVFDIDPQTLALTPHVYPANTPECLSHDPLNGFVMDLGHADFALNPFDSNEDVLIGQRSSGCPSSVGGQPMAGVVMVRLRDGFVTMLTDPANEAFPHHLSTRNLDRPGWVYASYYPASGQRFDDEVVAIKLDGSGACERLAHIHSAISGCYRCEPHAVPSRDGQRVIFASNWAAFCSTGCGSSSEIKDYVVSTSRTITPPPLDTTAPAAINDLHVK